jgi:CelD/BcsL family acetyltransferase involved in cellulose biosynthesis
MRIVCFTTLDDLLPYADDWDRLAAGVPFRTWPWLSLWWQHYGPVEDGAAQSQLAVLCAFDDADTIAGIAPWYIEHSVLYGRVLRALGSGEVCSDYLSILCRPSMEEAVVEALAEYLMEQTRSDSADALSWDLLDLQGVDEGDCEMAGLATALAHAGCHVLHRSRWSCWRLTLPPSWEAYIAGLGSNYRRDLRRLERRYFDTNRIVLKTAECLDDLYTAMDLLLDLHQLRHKTKGEPGCFASRRFTSFYGDVAPELLRRGHLDFCWLELDGKPVAVEYQLAGNGILYAYQAGVDPGAMKHEPGKLIYLAILKRAIARGYRGFDFLRGDERYKARFGAVARPSVEFRAVPHRAAARARERLWLAGDHLKHWVKRQLGSPTSKPAKYWQPTQEPQLLTPSHESLIPNP